VHESRPIASADSVVSREMDEFAPQRPASSKLFSRARSEGPQIVTKHGKES
jgi:hypothetical protein